MKIAIYTDNITERVKFAFKLVLTEILGFSVYFTSSEETFRNTSDPKINYSKKNIQDSIQVCPHSLLFERNVKPISVNPENLNHHLYFFRTNDEGILPFDIFAAAFFLASRYEEYLPFDADKFGRFGLKNSIAHHKGFYQFPVINQWAEDLLIIMRNVFKTEIPDNRVYSFIPTIDIDNPWAFLHKGFLRTTGGLVKDFTSGAFGRFYLRKSVLTHQLKDPFDTFDYLKELHEKHGVNPIYFFLLGPYNRFGKNPSPDNNAYINLIKSVSAINDTGIHLSFPSNFSEKEVVAEIDLLQKITGKPVSKNRQHFLMMSFPETYNRLINSGIKEDYSLIFPESPGFRTGTCSSYNWYDLSNEKITDLKIVPTCIMDTTFNEYLKLTPEKALNEINIISDRVKKVKGLFVSLWHNESLSGIDSWKGWERLYDQVITLCKEL